MQAFGVEKSLSEMSSDEWELLCDGCGLCCLHILEDPDTGEYQRLGVACKLLDIERCQCSRYADRKAFVPACISLKAEGIESYDWLPSTCAYRLLHEGKELPAWHPLISEDPETVHRAHISVRGKVVSGRDVDEDDLVLWLDDENSSS